MTQQETQLLQIKNHLKKGEKITTWQAITEYGITRLPRYIHTLRSQGMEIADEWKESNGKRFKEFFVQQNFRGEVCS